MAQELGITAVLLGALVHHGLLEDVSLRIALRFVAEALAQPPGNKLLRFAQLAVGEFRSDIGAWPDFCAQLLKVHGWSSGSLKQLRHVWLCCFERK